MARGLVQPMYVDSGSDMHYYVEGSFSAGPGTGNTDESLFDLTNDRMSQVLVVDGWGYVREESADFGTGNVMCGVIIKSRTGLFASTAQMVTQFGSGVGTTNRTNHNRVPSGNVLTVLGGLPGYAAPFVFVDQAQLRSAWRELNLPLRLVDIALRCSIDTALNSAATIEYSFGFRCKRGY